MKKPKPPADLWERMDALRQECFSTIKEPPPNSFVTKQYMERYKTGKSAANDQIRKLIEQGKLKKETGYGGRPYYVPVHRDALPPAHLCLHRPGSSLPG